MTAIASHPPKTTATTTASSPRPLPGESQADFALRFHDAMASTIPETDVRNDAMFDAWESHGDDGGLMQRAIRRFNEKEFKRYRRVPIFAEHSTKQTRKDEYGKSRDEVVVYDRRALAAVAERCNSRIRDTGDFAPLTDGHTPLEIDDPMPDVLGYDGPFRVGMIGNENPRWAIFAEEWHDRDELPRLKKLTRRSPEVWKEERMEDRIIDPVAALGAETPRLDLGTGRYSRPRIGRRVDGVGTMVERYSATPMPVPVATGANTTYVPGGSGKNKTDRKDRYESGGESAAMTEQELDLVVEKCIGGIMASEPFQTVTAAARKIVGDEESAADGGDGLDMDASGDMVSDVDAASDMGDDSAGDVSQVTSEEDRETKHYQCDDDDREMMRRYMADEVSDEEMTQYRSGRRKKTHYMADDGDVEGTEVNTESGDVADDGVDQYSRVKGKGKSMGKPATTGVRSQREREEVARYQRLQDENKKLNERLSKLESRSVEDQRERRKAERYSKLSQLRTYYAFDVDEEAADTADFNDKQFERHLDRIQDRYQRIPIEARIHVPAEANAPEFKPRGDGNVRREATQEESRRAIELVDRYRRRDPDSDITFEDALEEIRKSPEGDGKTKTA